MGALMAAAAACGQSGAPAANTSRGLPAVQVRTAVVSRQSLSVTVAATATITGRPGGVASIGAPAPGRITRVFVAVGDRVRRGDPLVTLDAAPFQAAFDQTLAAQRSAQQAYARASRLAAQGILARRDVEQARTALAQTAAALVVARQSLKRATLRSPIDGVVSRTTAVRDAAADPTQTLVEVVDPASLEARVLLAPEDAARVPLGATVTLLSGVAGGSAVVVGTGRVIALAATVDSLTGAVAARVQVVRQARTLRVGEVVRATLETEARPNTLVVPTAALVPASLGDGYQIFVVSAGDTARARPVRVGVRTELVVEIIAGVSAGEEVVADGAYGVEDGSRVVRGAPAVPPVAASGTAPAPARAP